MNFGKEDFISTGNEENLGVEPFPTTETPPQIIHPPESKKLLVGRVLGLYRNLDEALQDVKIQGLEGKIPVINYNQGHRFLDFGKIFGNSAGPQNKGNNGFQLLDFAKILSGLIG